MRVLTPEFVKMRTEQHDTVITVNVAETNLRNEYSSRMSEEHDNILKLIDEFQTYIDELRKYYTEIYNTIIKHSQNKLRENINEVIQKINDILVTIKKKFASFKNQTIQNKINDLKKDIDAREKANNEFASMIAIDEKNNAIKLEFNKNIDIINENISSIDKLQQYCKIEDNTYLNLINKFMTVHNEYKILQSTMQRTHRDYVKKVVRVNDNTIDDTLVNECVDDIITTGKTGIINLQNCSLILLQIENRHSSILKLEESIKLLHDLFLDFAIMVNSQGEMLDNICANIHKTYTHTYNAKKYIIHANKYNKNIHSSMICISCISCLIIVLLIILFTIMNTVFHII